MIALERSPGCLQPSRRSSAGGRWSSRFGAIRGYGRSKLHADKGYDNPRVRRCLRRRGFTARIARIGRDSSQRLGRHRWVVERTIGWLLSYKRLALRYNRTALTVTALARLVITLICARRLPRELAGCLRTNATSS